MVKRLQFETPTILTERASQVSYDDGSVELLNQSAKFMLAFAEDGRKRVHEQLVESAVIEGQKAGLDQGVEFKPVSTNNFYQKTFNTSAFSTAAIDMDMKMREAVTRISTKYPMSPGAQQQALTKYADSFAAELPDEMLIAFRSNFSKLQAASIATAKVQAQAFEREKARANFLLMEDTYFDDVNKTIRPMFDTGEVTEASLAALEQARRNYADHLLQNGPGVPFNLNGLDFPANNSASRAFSVSEIAQKMKDYDDAVEQKLIEVGAIKIINSSSDPEAELNKFVSGQLDLELPTPDGNIALVNVADVADESTKRAITSIVGIGIKERDAAISKKRQVRVSNYELAIAVAGDDAPNIADPNFVGPQAPALTKVEKLNNLLQSIERDPVFLGSDGMIKANDLKKKIFNALEDESDRIDKIRTGYNIANGAIAFNPQDTDQKKAFNEFYKEHDQQLAQATPEQRVVAKSQIIVNSNHVPSLEKGRISSAARSQDPTQILEAISLIESVTDKNPHLLPSMADPKDMNRLKMVSDRIRAGMDGEKAIETVDKLLDPRNAPSQERIKEEIKAIEKQGIIKQNSYRNRTIAVLDTFSDELSTVLPFGRSGLEANKIHVQEQIDQATLVYRTAFEDTYSQTLDVTRAEQAASEAVRGQFSRTAINGTPEIMRFAPEKYYSISGLSDSENQKWMRKQMVDAAMDDLKNTLSSKPISRKELNDMVAIIPHEEVTRATAANGAPAYHLVIFRDGIPVKLLGQNNYFTFDKKKAADELIITSQEFDRREAEAVQKYGPFSLEVNKIRQQRQKAGAF
jgi:hypothetical protein